MRTPRLRRVRPVRTGDPGPLIDQGEGRLFAPLPRAPAEGLVVAHWVPAPGWQAVGAGLLPLTPALAALSLSAPVTALFLAGALLLAWHAAEAAAPAQRGATIALHGPFWDRLLALAPEAFARLPVPILAHRLMSGLRAARHATLRGAQARRTSLTAAGAAALLGAASPTLALLALPVLAAGAALVARLAGTAARAGEVAQWQGARAGARLGEVAPALPELRPLGATGWARRRRLGSADRAHRAGRRAEAAARHLELASLGLPLLLALSLALASQAGLSPGLSLSALAAALLAGLPLASATASLAAGWGQGRGLAGRLAALERSIGPGAPADPPGGLPVPAFARLDVRGLSFTWPGAARPTLHDLTFTLARGELLVLAGPSGGGKSTLIRLLLGLLTPQSGTVLLNGAPIRGYDPAPLRRRLGAVLQDEVETITTIRDAVSGPVPLTEADILALLAVVGLTELVEGLPMGLQTLVVEGVFPAAMLGRLRLARALASGPDLLFLDESLAVFEAAEAGALLGALRARGLTLVVCAHDPAVIAMADQVLRIGAASDGDGDEISK